MNTICWFFNFYSTCIMTVTLLRIAWKNSNLQRMKLGSCSQEGIMQQRSQIEDSAIIRKSIVSTVRKLKG